MPTRSDERLVSRLKITAAKRKISLYRLSQEMGVSASTLTMIAKGERHASPAILVALCDALDCRVEDLLEVIPAARRITERENKSGIA